MAKGIIGVHKLGKWKRNELDMNTNLLTVPI